MRISHLENIKLFLDSQYNRAADQIDESTIVFTDQMSGLDGHIYVVEEEGDSIYGYSTYLPPLDGPESSLRIFSDELLKRNAGKLIAAYAKTDDDWIVVKGGFSASSDPEVTQSQFVDLWLEIRDLLEYLPTDSEWLPNLQLSPGNEF